MKIIQVVLHHAKCQRVHGTTEHFIFIELKTDEGLIGYGEMCDYAPGVHPSLQQMLQMVSEVVVGRTPFDVTAIDQALREKRVYSPSSVQFALFDLMGKACKVPVYEFLGGKIRDKFQVAFPIFTWQHPIPKQLELVQYAHDKGIRALRVYIREDPTTELLLKAIQDRFPEMRIKDFDGPMAPTAKRAIRVIKRLEKFNVDYVETPDRLIHNAEISNAIDLPISEHIGTLEVARNVIEKRYADIMNVSVWNGFHYAKAIIQLAEEAGLQYEIGTTQELGIATAAQAHLGASMRNMPYICDPCGPVVYPKDVVEPPLRFEDGFMHIPTGLGLGVNLDRTKLAHLLVETAGEKVYP